MRIAVITSSFPRYLGDGAGTFVYSLCRELQRCGQDVYVLASDDPLADDTWQSDVEVSRVRYVWPRRLALIGHAGALEADVSLRWYAYPLAALFAATTVVRLVRSARHERPDVIFAQWIVPGGLIGAVASRLSGTPLVIAVHGSDVFVVTRNRMARMMGQAALRHARAVITCSRDFARRATALGASPATTTTIPYGVDVLRFAPDDSARQWLAGKLGVEAHIPVLIAMGRLVYKKGFAVLLEAMPAIIDRFPDALLVIAGSGVLDSALAEHSQALHVERHVVFLGHVPWQETQHYLAGATVVVVPSIVDQAGNVDGLPNVLLEAMACGCAIVGSDVAGIPDVIVDGVNGIVVPPQDSKALAEAVIQVVASPETGLRLGANARQTAVSELTWSAVASRVLTVLSAASEGSPDET